MMLEILQDEVDNDVEKIVHIQENYYDPNYISICYSFSLHQ